MYMTCSWLVTHGSMNKMERKKQTDGYGYCKEMKKMKTRAKKKKKEKEKKIYVGLSVESFDGMHFCSPGG